MLLRLFKNFSQKLVMIWLIYLILKHGKCCKPITLNKSTYQWQILNLQNKLKEQALARKLSTILEKIE